MAFRLRFTVGIITETNLRDEEADSILIPGYQIIDKIGDNKHRGGVLILAESTAHCVKQKNIPKPPRPIDACVVMLYPTGKEDYAIRITGIYIPPKLKQPRSNLQRLLRPDFRHWAREDSASAT